MTDTRNPSNEPEYAVTDPDWLAAHKPGACSLFQSSAVDLLPGAQHLTPGWATDPPVVVIVRSEETTWQLDAALAAFPAQSFSGAFTYHALLAPRFVAEFLSWHGDQYTYEATCVTAPDPAAVSVPMLTSIAKLLAIEVENDSGDLYSAVDRVDHLLADYAAARTTVGFTSDDADKILCDDVFLQLLNKELDEAIDGGVAVTAVQDLYDTAANAAAADTEEP